MWGAGADDSLRREQSLGTRGSQGPRLSAGVGTAWPPRIRSFICSFTPSASLPVEPTSEPAAVLTGPGESLST